MQRTVLRSHSAWSGRGAGVWSRIVEDAEAWATGRNWMLRAPLVVFLVYVGVRQFGDAEYACIVSALNLGIHEAGHFVFRPLGEVLHAGGGTLLQLLAPVAAAVMFLQQRDWFAITVCLGWLSTNLHNVGTYMADAEEMRLPLVSVGPADMVHHDWHFLFDRFDVLHRCEAIGALAHGLAHLTMAAAVVSGAWLLWTMARTR